MQDLSSMAMALVVLIVVLVVGGKILTTIQAQETSTVSAAYNVTNYGGAALGLFGSWFNILVIVTIATVVIGLLIGYFQRAV